MADEKRKKGEEGSEKKRKKKKKGGTTRGDGRWLQAMTPNWKSIEGL